MMQLALEVVAERQARVSGKAPESGAVARDQYGTIEIHSKKAANNATGTLEYMTTRRLRCYGYCDTEKSGND